MTNKKMLSKKDAMNFCNIRVTYVFKLNGEGIKDSQLKRMTIENPPTIERCKKHVHVYGAFAIEVARIIKNIMEEHGFDVDFYYNDKDDAYNVVYDSKTYSDKYIECVFTKNLEAIFQTISIYIHDELSRIA